MSFKMLCLVCEIAVEMVETLRVALPGGVHHPSDEERVVADLVRLLDLAFDHTERLAQARGVYRRGLFCEQARCFEFVLLAS